MNTKKRKKKSPSEKARIRRYNRYHDTVWKGWSRSEKPSKVTTYSIEELKERENK